MQGATGKCIGALGAVMLMSLFQIASASTQLKETKAGCMSCHQQTVEQPVKSETQNKQHSKKKQ